MKVNPKILVILNLPFIHKFIMRDEERDITHLVNATRIQILRSSMDNRVPSAFETTPCKKPKYLSHDITLYSSKQEDPNVISLQGDFLFIYGTVDFITNHDFIRLRVRDFYSEYVDTLAKEVAQFVISTESTKDVFLCTQQILVSIPDNTHLNTVLYKFSKQYKAHYSKRRVGDDLYSLGSLLPSNGQVRDFIDTTTYDVEWKETEIIVKIKDLEVYRIPIIKPTKEH